MRIQCWQLVDDLARGGGSSLIFVRGCSTSGSQTPPFGKARQRQKSYPVLRQIMKKEKESRFWLSLFFSVYLSSGTAAYTTYRKNHPPPRPPCILCTYEITIVLIV